MTWSLSFSIELPPMSLYMVALPTLGPVIV
jgi:hypothetical protein